MTIRTSLHDHHVTHLAIDVPARTLRIATSFFDGSTSAEAEAIFEGLEAYVLEGDALGTILDDIVPVEPLALLGEFASRMQATYRRYGGHPAWVLSMQDAEEHFAKGQLQGYRVDSSIGFVAAVWARSLDTRWLTTG